MERTSIKTHSHPHKTDRWIKIKKAIWIILTAVEILTIIINLSHYLNFPKQGYLLVPQKISGYTSEEEGKFKAKDGSSGKPEIIFEYEKISPGMYHGVIEYDTENTQKLTFSALPSAYLEANDLFLDHRLNKISFYFTVYEPVNNLQIAANFEGEKNFSAKLEVNKDRIIYIRNIVTSAMIFTLIAAELFLFSKHPKIAKESLLVLSISAIAFVPYLLEGITSGHDFPFHYIRIEGIADGLRNRQFPVYLQSNWVSDHGYPAALFYGDILLYIPALFRLSGFYFETAFKIFVFLINVLTSYTAFISFRKIFKNEKISWVLTFTYLCTPYRLIDIYVRCAVGEYCAMAFLPLVCSGFYGIIKTETDHQNYKNEIASSVQYLSVGMAGILLTHILTTIMSAVILIISCLLLYKRVFNFNRLKAFFISALRCIILSAFFLVPFIDFYFSNDLDINHDIGTQIPTIQSSGVQPGEFFAFFKDIFGDGYENSGLGDRLYFSLGMTLTLTIAAAVICICKNKSSKMLRVLTFLSFLCIFLSSNLFPYNALAYGNRIGIYLSQIQFPWRFLSMASLLTVLIMGELLTICEKNIVTDGNASQTEIKKYLFPAVLSVISFFIFLETSIINGNYASEAKRNHYLNTNDIEIGKVLIDHGLRYESNPDYFIKNIETDDVSIEIIKRQGFHFRLHCRTEEASGAATLPLTNYEGYKIIDENGQEYNIYENWNKEIGFMVQSGFDGIIDVFFQPKWYWTASAVISFLYMVYTAFVCAAETKSKRRV